METITIKPIKPTKEQEKMDAAYLQGRRAAQLDALSLLARELGYLNMPLEVAQFQWIMEREATIAMLRQVCGEFGDNDWGVNLHLADIIEKHLLKHLRERKE